MQPIIRQVFEKISIYANTCKSSVLGVFDQDGNNTDSQSQKFKLGSLDSKSPGMEWIYNNSHAKGGSESDRQSGQAYILPPNVIGRSVEFKWEQEVVLGDSSVGSGKR